MKLIADILEKKAYTRLNERYGVLVDRIGVKEELDPLVGLTFEMKFQLSNWKRMDPSGEKERVIGVGVAEIECALYNVLNFSDREQGIHRNNNLPENGIYMHREIYKKLMESERESMRKIEERLGQLDKQKGAILG